MIRCFISNSDSPIHKYRVRYTAHMSDNFLSAGNRLFSDYDSMVIYVKSVISYHGMCIDKIDIDDLYDKDFKVRYENGKFTNF